MPSVDKGLVERLIEEVGHLRAGVDRVRDGQGELDTRMATLVAEMSNFLSLASSRLDAAERKADDALSQLRVIRIWSAAAVFIVPGTVGAISWLLERLKQ